MMTLEHLIWNDMAEVVDDHLKGKDVQMQHDGTCLVDGEVVAPCLEETLRCKSEVYKEARRKALKKAKRCLDRAQNGLPEGAKVTLYGTKFTKVSFDWNYSI